MNDPSVATSPWREAVKILTDGYKKHFYNRTKAFLTAGGKVNLSAGTAGFTGVLPMTQGGTGNDMGFQDHDHSGTRRQGQQLEQANTHEAVDTDTATTALHHTLGDDNFQAAPGNHALVGSNHTVTGLTTGNVLTATGSTTFDFQAAPAGSAWQILTAGTILAPTLVFAGGQIVMIEIYR